MNCPECGAADNACESRFNACLALEFSDPAFGSVHHLTVATYMLQHSSKLTCEGWLNERDVLKAFLVEKKPPAILRKETQDLLDSGKRTFKIKSRDGRSVTGKNAWAKTILDLRMENARDYCTDVVAWAKSVLK